MGWFERHAQGRDVREVQREHARYVRASGIDRALDELSGPYGLRRYVLFFERRGARVEITDVRAEILQWGGGPPPEDPTGNRVARVERALTALHRNMSTGPRWEQGAIGYVRDAAGASRLVTWFDEDRADASLLRLPMPGPPGHPLEAPQHRRLLAQWEARMLQVQAASRARSHGWTQWTVHDGRALELEYGEEGQPGFDRRRFSCVLLGVYTHRPGRFEWEVDEPLFEEPIFCHAEIACDLGAAAEIALLAAARLGAAWLFSGTIGEGEATLFAAVRE